MVHTVKMFLASPHTLLRFKEREAMRIFLAGGGIRKLKSCLESDEQDGDYPQRVYKRATG